MIVAVTVYPNMSANARVIAASLAVLAVGEQIRIAAQNVRRADKGKFLVNGRDAGPGPLAVQVLESLATEQEATDAVLQAARAEAAALQVAFAARRQNLPAGDVLETAALADPGLRTLTPALLAAACDDPACAVVGIPCLFNIGDLMVNAKIVGAESRPDPRLADKYGHELYPGVTMIRETGGVEVWHKITRRSVMIAADLAASYEPAQNAKAASKADAGLARLNAQAARAAADLAVAQQKAQEAAAALMRASGGWLQGNG